MVTFNFSNAVAKSAAQEFGSRLVVPIFTSFPSMTPGGGTTFVTTTFPSTLTFGTNPLKITSALTGVGLPGDTMVFTVTATSAWYSMSFRSISDELDLNPSFGLFGSTATFELTFDAGSGLTGLSNVSVNGGAALGGAAYLTAGGGTAPVGAGIFAGEITGIRFVVTGPVTLSSITGTPTCFAAGTRIATPGGQTEVQNLSAGDTVLTMDGEEREVLWLGRQTFDTTHGVPEHLRPVRIGQGALGGGLPERDLVVTAEHALFLDGCLINAAALVNGETITFDGPDRMHRAFTVYHIETRDHAIIRAEGVPAETFIDYRDRRLFDNFDDYLALCGAERIIPEMPAPRISARRLVPEAIRRRLGLPHRDQSGIAIANMRAG